MGKIIVANAVQRKKGYMYYIDGQGNLCMTKMRHTKEAESPKKS